jgi:Flp pilus assembly protein CpaB
MKKKRLLVIIGAIVVIMLIVILNLSQRDSGEKVEVALVEMGNVTSVVTSSGELKAGSQVDISAETIATRVITSRRVTCSSNSMTCRPTRRVNSGSLSSSNPNRTCKGRRHYWRRI